MPSLCLRPDGLKAGLTVFVLLAGGLSGCNRPDGPSEPSIKQGSSAAWASGGTAAMRGPYPEPFTGTEPCSLMPALTAGPCYVPGPRRQDISEGLPGLPMRLSLRVVRAGTCEPVPNAEVDVWHTGPAGSYSGFAPGTMCNRSETSTSAARFGRGVQVTDANGRVDFDSVFPGWYPGRTVHVHLTVRVGGSEALTSQLVFDDALTNEITTTHPDYRGRSAPDTRNQDDSLDVRSGQFTLRTERRSDGSLHAWRTIAIR